MKRSVLSLASCAMVLGIVIIGTSACGGNSSSQTTAPIIPATMTGQFSDLTVSGLSYATASKTGTTDTANSYTYEAGESITFSIGDTTIGDTTAAKSTLTLYDLIAGAIDYTTLTAVRSVSSTNPKSPEAIAFRRLANTLQLLQMCDTDGDPDNGIQISAETQALFSGVNLNFDDDINLFSQSRRLADIFVPAQEAGVLPLVSIRTPGEVLEHYYQANGITHQFMAPVRLEIDTDIDDSVDRVVMSDYDSFGNLTLETIDEDNDGQPDSIYTTTYDASGRPRVRTLDHDGDGVAETTITTTVDSFGRIIMRATDDNGDGIDDNVVTTEYLTEERVEVTTTDTDNDGVSDSITRTEFNIEGLHARTELDNNADGIVDCVTVNEYDEDDNPITTSTTYPNGLFTDRVITRTFDATGNVFSQMTDTGADGDIDSIRRMEFDERGNQTLSQFDDNADGDIDLTITTEYDEQGKQTRREVQLIEQPYAFAPSITLLSYDVNGNLAQRTTYLNGSDTATGVVTYEFDEFGNLLTLTSNSDALSSKTTHFNTNVNWTTALSAASAGAGFPGVAIFSPTPITLPLPVPLFPTVPLTGF